MLQLRNYERLAELLIGATDLASLMQQHDPRFEDRVLDWFGTLANELKQNRLPEAARVSAHHLQLLAAKRARTPEPGAAPRTRRARFLAQASEAVQRTVELVSASLAADRASIGEVEGMAASMAAAILNNGIKLTELGADHSERMLQLIAHLKRNASTKDAVIHLEGRVGALDLMILMDRALSRLERERKTRLEG